MTDGRHRQPVEPGPEIVDDHDRPRRPTDGHAARGVVGGGSRTVPIIIGVAVALVAVGILGRNVIPVRPSPSPSEAAVASPSPSSTTPPLDLAWETIPVDRRTFESAVVGSLVTGRQGLVAFGQDVDDFHPITWTSTDGRSWARHDQPATAFGGAVPTQVVLVHDGLIAVGERPNPGGPASDVWVSADGVTWHRTRSPSARGFDGAWFLASTGDRAVLLGSQGRRHFVLATDDGETWTAPPDTDPLSSAADSIAGVVGTDRGFVAVATTASGGVVYRSDDGVRWATVDAGGAFEQAQLGQVVATSQGLLIDGYVGGTGGFGGGHGWWSSSDDGGSWSTARPSPLADATIGVAYRLAGGDVILLDTRRFDGGDGDAILRASSDGAAWEAVQRGDWSAAQLSRQAVSFRGRLLVMGSTSDATVGVWAGRLVRGTASEVSDVASPSPAIASSTASPSPAAVTDHEAAALDWRGLTSRTVFESDLGDLELTAIAPDGDGFLGVGYGGNGIAVWQAADPFRWERLPTPAMMRGAYPVGIARVGSRIVVAGSRPDDTGNQLPFAWSSPDGRRWEASPLGMSGVNDIARGPGGVVVIGIRADNVPVSVRSADGVTWEEAEVVSDDTNVNVGAIAAGPRGYVIVGAGSFGAPAAWVSPDGVSWTPSTVALATPSDSATGVGWLTDVAWVRDRFVAVGGGQPARPVVLDSPDGLTWTEVPTDPAMRELLPTRVAAFGSGVAVLGGVGGGGRFGGRGTEAPSVWTWDGAAWTEQDVASAHDGRGGVSFLANDLVSSSVGLLVVGSRFGQDGRVGAGVWVGSAGAIVPDHVCPPSIDVAALSSMSAADLAGCLSGRPTVLDVAISGTPGTCGDGGSDLAGCQTSLSIRSLADGSVTSVAIDAATAGQYAEGSRWRLTVATGIASPTCTPPRAVNGVAYDGARVAAMQCAAILRVVKAVRLAG